ncbi:glycoside hydrolase family 12 protein [Mycena vitilis]|nr:glycoside hydrolase family 12 protein [Mycena vitilis]
MKFIGTAILALALAVSAFPAAKNHRTLAQRGVKLSGKFESKTEENGRFVLENNLWGQSAATGGSQTTQLTGASGKSVTWHTTYNWAGGKDSVKSYANMDLKEGLGKSLASITSVPTAWHWTYTSASSGLIADVSYDLWLSKTAGTLGASADSSFEIMIWLSARGGATPAGTEVGTASVNGVAWKLFQGTIKTWTIFSFVAPTEITKFDADLKPFMTFLTQKHGVPSSHFLVQAQAGTEPFEGSATLKTDSYSLSIN